MSAPLAMPEVNSLDREAFVGRFGAVYEHSPWIAQRAWEARPFADREALESALREAIATAGPARQLGLLRAHPRLGTLRALTSHSQSEQAQAGIDSADAVQREQLERLNDAYEKKFGFPFILAVRGADMAQILASMQARIGHDAATEFAQALRQVQRIAHFRLTDLVSHGATSSR